MAITDDTVLTKSALRAGKLMGLSDDALASALGVEPERISAMAAELQDLSSETASGQRGVTLVKIYSELVANVGQDTEACRRWVASHNEGLGGTPALLMQCKGGMELVLAYLQGMGDCQGS